MKRFYFFISLTALLLTTSAQASELQWSDFLTKAETERVKELMVINDTELTINPLSEYPIVKIAFYLGDGIVCDPSKDDKALGEKLLRELVKHPDAFTEHELARIYSDLGWVNDEKDIEQAKIWYKKAQDLGDLGSCVNLGLLYEREEDYQKAAHTYQQCALDPDGISVVDKEEVALAYLNLGTLYYNGALEGGRSTANQKHGGDLWQTSYELNPYDSDINFNLGVYHLHFSKDYPQSRYHFVSCTLKDLACATKLSNRRLMKLSAEKEYLTELLNKKGYSRLHLLEDRAEHFLGNKPIYWGEQGDYGTIELLSNDGEHIKGVAMTFEKEFAAEAMMILARLVYIDSFSLANMQTYMWASGKLKPRFGEHLGQKWELQRFGHLWRFQIRFED